MSRDIRNKCRRFVAFALSIAMVISNLGANAGTVFAAEKKEKEIALFMLDGQEMLEAIRDLDGQEAFDVADLDLGSENKSITREYEKLLDPAKGKVYALSLEVDDQLAPEDTSLLTFYRTATEDVVFLFVNESSEAYSFCVNIDGYETKLVTVNPNGASASGENVIEGTEEEKEASIFINGSGGASGGGSGAGGSSGGSTVVIGDSISDDGAAADNGESDRSTSDDAAGDKSDAADKVTDDKGDGSDRSDTASDKESSDGGKTNSAASDKTDSGSGSAESGKGSSESGSSSSGSDQSDSGSSAGGSSDSGSKEISISYHSTAFVAVALDDIQDGQEEVDEIITEKEERSEEEEQEATQETKEEETKEELSETEETEGEVSEESTGEEAAEDRTEGTEGETAGDTEETKEETVSSGETEEGSVPDDSSNGENDLSDSNGQTVLDDEWEIPGKAYDGVTIWQTARARAYCVDLEEICRVVEYNAGLEALHVDYQVIPDGAAKIVGADTVKINGTLHFAVEPEEDFEIVSVTANGLAAEEVTDAAALEEAEDTEDADGEDGEAADLTRDRKKAAKDDEAESLAEWKRYAHVYKVEAEDEDLVIEVGLEEKLIPAKTYKAETEDAVFTVDVPDGAFAEEVELKVSRIKDEMELKTYADQANEALAADKAVAEVRAYDLSFTSEKTGEEVEPTETVSVNIQFKKVPVAKDVDEDQVTGLSVVHLPEGEDAKVMASVDSVKETEMEFKTDSFSVYAVTLNTDASASTEGKGFATMQEAIDAAENGSTIRLEKDIQENVEIEDKEITIDINGKTWLSKNNYSNTGEASIITVKNSTLKLIGSGKISGTPGNAGYRTITATQTHLIIGEEGGNGPTIEGNNGNGNYGLSKETYQKTRGGVILAEGGSVVMDSGIVQKGSICGSSTSYGGGIAVIGGDGFTMNGGTITQNINKNSGTRYGGGVSVEKANFTMNGGEISGNTSGSYGGGVYVGGAYNAKAQVKIENGVITKNTASSYGGGLYVSYCDVSTDNATFSENKASSWGGGVFAYFSTAMTFNNSRFTDNTAMYRGGGICSHNYNDQKLIINACTITGNKLTKTSNTMGAGISDESYGANGTLEITGGTVITENTLSGGKGGGIYALKKSGETINLVDVIIAGNEASYGGGVAIDTGTGNLSAAKKPSVVITDETKVYGNTAKEDNTVAGTTAHVSDEFLFFTKDSNAKKTGFEDHEVVVEGMGYKLADGGDSLVETGSTSKGYYNYQESKIRQDECIGNGDVYLDPAEKTELYVWLTDEDGKQHGEKLTKENGLCVTLKDAYEAATREGASGLIYVCSQVAIGAEDNAYFSNPDIRFIRYKTSQSDYMFTVKSGEEVTFVGVQIDGAKVESSKALVEVGPNSTLNIGEGTVLENGKNTNKSGGGGAVYVHGLNYTIEPGILKMTGGIIRNNSAYKGGGIYATSGNQAYNHSTEVILTGGEIIENTATNDGGGISIVNSATLKMEAGNAVIKGNVCGAQGGGICIGSEWGRFDASEAYIYSGTISGNRCIAESNNYAGGGGIHIWTGSTMRMKNVYIHDNYATGDVLGQAALYSCPTGKLAIFELDGALLTNNKSKVWWASFPDISFLGKGRYADVSEYALGGGENNWLKGTPGSTEPAPKSYYQKTTSSFYISSKVLGDTIALAENEATVFLTENESHQPGSAIANNGTLIIGTETKALEVVKEWKDEEGNVTDDHPHQVIVNLAYKDDDGKIVVLDADTRKDARQILSEKNEWRYCWDKLGENTDWTVVEANVTGFAPEISEAVKVENPLLNDFYRVTITNKKDEDADPGSLTVSKKVHEKKKDPAGDATESNDKGFAFDVKLTAPGTGIITYYITDAEGNKGNLQVIKDTSHFEVSIEEGGAFTVEGLPVETGYTITETDQSRKNYAVYINGQLTENDQTGQVKGIIGKKDSAGEVKVEDPTKVEFAYTNVETIDIVGLKIWTDGNDQDGIRPPNITVILTAKSITPGLSYSKTYTKVVSEADEWTWSFKGLPKYDTAGELLDYTISEDIVPGYSMASASNAAGKYDIENIHTPNVTSRTVKKSWKDGDDQDRVRPDSVTVQLWKKVGVTEEPVPDVPNPVTLSAGSEQPWEYTWGGLPENEAGNPIEYFVKELDVPEGYTPQIDSTGYTFIITNTYPPLTVSKTVEKRWDDNEDRDKLRPASVQVRLLADGQEAKAEVDTPVVTLDASNGWKHTWEGLPVNNAGTAISYTVEEINVPDGYTPTYGEDPMVITNTHTPETPPPETPDNPGGNPPRRSRRTHTNIPDEGTPLSDEGVPLAGPPDQPEKRIIDETVPLFGLAKTGDSRHMGFWMALFGISGIGIFLTMAKRKKSESDGEE